MSRNVRQVCVTSIDATLPLRNDLLGEEPYGAPQLDVPVALNVNENPYALSDQVVEQIAHDVAAIAPTLNRYPDREHIALRRAFATYLERESDAKLEVEQLWAANGSNEIMLQLFQAFGGPGRVCLSADPTYSMYPEYARDTFTSWQTVARDEDFNVNVSRLCEEITRLKPAMVLLTSPNNPTGTPLSLESVCEILDFCKQVEVDGASSGVHPIVIIDEAYIEFRSSDQQSAVTLLNRYDHLAVSRTMSKAFAFAGARVGYVAASKGIIDCLRIVRMPYHLSALTQAAALAALKHTDAQLEAVAHLRDLREQTAEWLRTLSWHGRPLQVAPSASNFVMFGGNFENRHAIFEGMLSRGVLIREVGPDGWLRVCMGTDEEMAIFRQALEQTLAELEN